MERKMTEKELIERFDKALEENHIYVCYQPKMNHSTSRMIGAEALMRWRDPQLGMQYPSDFIPVLEENDLVYRADLHLFGNVCAFQKKALDGGISAVPVSVNMSRYDIMHDDYIDELDSIRKRYGVPTKYLHVEITESSAIGGMDKVVKVLKKLHKLGYIVEMDDFGSGYSSLNVLKDLDVDVIKLDMRFLSGNIGGRGGTIISSVVQMTKWLNTPVVAEGVETLEQANYMKSIGCPYIQGYLYSKPVGEDEFIQKLKKTEQEPVEPAIDLIGTMNAPNFWDPNSMETLIFNNYVGGAAIFTYQNGRMELLRINEKYAKEIGMHMSEKEILCSDPLAVFDEENCKKYEDALRSAIKSGEEVICETWRTVCSKICGEDKICIRSYIRRIGRAGEEYLFYAMVQNVTAEKKRYESLSINEKKLRFASDQINVFAWEYTIATKQMRPCYRCMRYLGLPPVVENYPEPVIENGIFPQDYADMYRDWHRQLAEGVGHLEAIIPLTVGRVPFHVRYTTEFDENGKPLRAYGSAALVVDNSAMH